MSNKKVKKIKLEKLEWSDWIYLYRLVKAELVNVEAISPHVSPLINGSDITRLHLSNLERKLKPRAKE